MEEREHEKPKPIAKTVWLDFYVLIRPSGAKMVRKFMQKVGIIFLILIKETSKASQNEQIAALRMEVESQKTQIELLKRWDIGNVKLICKGEGASRTCHSEDEKWFWSREWRFQWERNPSHSQSKCKFSGLSIKIGERNADNERPHGMKFRWKFQYWKDRKMQDFEALKNSLLQDLESRCQKVT